MDFFRRIQSYLTVCVCNLYQKAQLETLQTPIRIDLGPRRNDRSQSKIVLDPTDTTSGRQSRLCCCRRRAVVSPSPASLSAAAVDLCFTAGPGEDVSVGSCRRLISPPPAPAPPSLTLAQLVDSTLWHFARKVVRGPRQINHWRGFCACYHKPERQCPVSRRLLTLNYTEPTILERMGTLGYFSPAL